MPLPVSGCAVPPMGGANLHPLLRGPSAAIGRARADLELFAHHPDVPILLEGASGSGKTAFAEAAHSFSPRAKEPFVHVALTEIEDGLINSELFGHVPGAFTGASANRTGLLASAGRGTVFIDEIAKASATAQARLLSVVETKRFRRVGTDRALQVDVRFVFASNVSLRRRVEERAFLPDFYERIKMFTVRVPTLAERRADIPHLIEFFVAQEAPQCGYSEPPDVDRDLLERFFAAPWPGNIRELHEAVQLLLVGARGAPVLTSAHLHKTLESVVPALRVRRPLTPENVRESLARHANSRVDTARDLGIDRTTLYRYIRRFDIEVDRCNTSCNVGDDVAQRDDHRTEECA